MFDYGYNTKAGRTIIYACYMRDLGLLMRLDGRVAGVEDAIHILTAGQTSLWRGHHGDGGF
jgi:hypothetical protein